MNKIGQKIRDCGRPRISSARPGAAMASVRHWAVPAVMAAALMLSGCQTLNPDSAEGASNSLLKAIAVAFVGGAAIWGSTGGGSSDDSPLLPTPRAEEASRLSGAFSAAVLDEDGRYWITTPLLNAPAGGGGFQIEILIPRDFMLLGARPEECEGRRCVVTIPPGQRSVHLSLNPQPGAGDPPPPPPMVSLILSDAYEIDRVLTFREPFMPVDDTDQASFRVFANAPPSTGDVFFLRFRVDGPGFTRLDGGTCDVQMDHSICTVTIPDDQTSADFVIMSDNNAPAPEWHLSLVPDNDNYDIQPTVGFFTTKPTSVSQNGRAMFTGRSNVVAPNGGFQFRFTIGGERANFAADQLAAIAAIVGSQANHIPCDGNICTVTIPEGETSATFTLIPVEEANPAEDAPPRWTVSLVPAGINDPFEIENGNRGADPIEVATTPTGVRGEFSEPEIINVDLRQISVQTPVLDRAAGSGGFNIDFTLSLNIRPVPIDDQPDRLVVDCTGTACTVTIPEGAGLDPLEIQLESVLVADVTDTTETGFVDDNREFGAPIVTNEMTGEVEIQTPTLADVATGPGITLMFTIANGFEPADNQPGGLDCTGTACTVTIPSGSTNLALSFVPTPFSPANPPDVAIGLPRDNNNVNILPPPPLQPRFVVGFDTPEPTVVVDPANGNATVTFVSDTNAPVDGLTVSFRITGDAFTAMLQDGTSVPCVGNVCTVVIPIGEPTATFILVSDGPRSPDSDLFRRWTVAVVDDTDNIYGIDGNNRVAVVDIEGITPIDIEGITPTAADDVLFTLDRNARVRFGEVTARFRPQALPGDLDILEIPHAARITAEGNANSFATIDYGYFADDGGFLPFNTSIVDLGFSPSLIGNFMLHSQDFFTGRTTWVLRSISQLAPSGGHQIGIRVGGVTDFTAMLEDGTEVMCPLNVCVVTIREGQFMPPNLVLTPTAAGLIGFDSANLMLEVAPIPRGNPLSPDPLSNNRANSDEAVFYARRGDKLVARFHTTGTFADTANVELLEPLRGIVLDPPVPPLGNNIALPPFVAINFDDTPAFMPRNCADLSGIALTTCNNFNAGIPAARIAHDARQEQLRVIHERFGANYLDFLTAVLTQSCSTAPDPAACFAAGVTNLVVNSNVQPRLIVDGRGIDFRTTLQEGNTVTINRPVAIALPITSTLVAAEDNVQELVYSYFVDAEDNTDGSLRSDGVIDLTPASEDPNGRQFDVFNTATVGSVDFALYQSGDIPDVPDALPPTEDFSISQIDSSRELLGRSNVRTFLYENEFSAIGAWLIPPTAEEVTADPDAPYYAAAAHWFGFETPVDRIPTAGRAVYGGIATGDFRQVTFDNAGVFAGKRSFYVHGSAQFEADFANAEMDGEFVLDAYNPRDVYGDPTLAFARSLDTLVVNWEGQILPDGRGFANNSFPAFEPLFDRNGNPVLNDAGDQLAREILAPAATLFQPFRVEEAPDSGDERTPVFDNLVQVGDDSGIPGAPPGPSPIGDGALFSVFGKFFGPGNAGTNPLFPFPEEVAGELRVFNSRTFVTVERTNPSDPATGESESVTSVLEVHFTATGDDVPEGRFDLPDIGEDFE